MPAHSVEAGGVSNFWIDNVLGPTVMFVGIACISAGVAILTHLDPNGITGNLALFMVIQTKFKEIRSGR